MDKTIRFSFVVHNHQPAGNFDRVFVDAFEHCYRPFVEVLSRHPHVKFTQHWTGTLLEWLNDHRPDFIRTLRTLVRRGQLELLTGSYYEAILPVIPPEDRVGQIRKLSAMIEDLFGVRPRGMWLAERVWEPHLVGSLASAGVQFVLLDDTHFRMAGIGDAGMAAYYRTEDCGTSVDVFPIDKTLRYLLPFRVIEEAKHHLQRMADEKGTRLLVHADDGEKFGVWPKTYASVYEEHWLEDFCEMLGQEQSWIKTVHLSEAVDASPPAGRVYLPTASYQEMMKWALPTDHAFQLDQFEKRLDALHAEDDRANFVRGSFWRNFLVKYPEANHMHKKMLRIAARFPDAGNEKRTELAAARDHLWAGQCNDAYWHGVFGGLYLPNLRFPVYRNLLKAEAILDSIGKSSGLRVETVDFDCDGMDEVIIEGRRLNLYLKPGTGGHLLELDDKLLSVNLLDILSRREEIYHRRLLAGTTGTDDAIPEAKEEGLEKHLYFDWYRHASLIDHFFADDTTVQSFGTARYLEMGDFVDRPYEHRVRHEAGSVVLSMERDGSVWLGEDRNHRIRVAKELTYRDGEDGFEVAYRIVNMERQPVELWFGIEFNVGLMAGDAPDRYFQIDGTRPDDSRLRSTGETPGTSRVKLVDEWLGLETEIAVNKPATVWRCPVETISLSEAGLERVYQSSIVVPHWRFRLEKAFAVTVRQSITSLNSSDRRTRKGPSA